MTTTPRSDRVSPVRREHDFTNPRWGHNVEITKWDSEAGTGSGFCWVTPALSDGDTMKVRSRRGSMSLVVSDVEWVFGVDDMFRFNASLPAPPVPQGGSMTAQGRVSPDCREAKHRACSGDAWDDIEDRPAACECPCHEPEEKQ